MEIIKVIFILASFCAFSVLGQQGYKVKHFTGCVSAGLCCEQVNNTCYVPNSRKLDGNVGNCFCDSKCLQMKDCCVDFEEHCKARDCIMGEWSEWSECSNSCGRGRKHRKRAILQEAAFGGKKCPTATKSKKGCYGEYGCLQQSVEYSREEIREVGYLMPATYSIYRVSKNYSPQHDIRKNLFFKNFQDNVIPRKPAYSAVFRVTHVGRACQRSSWAKVLEKGAEVCVECQPTSMNKRLERCTGHGVFHEETAWKAIAVRNCHGKWKMITHHDFKTCNHQGDHDFVLV